MVRSVIIIYKKNIQKKFHLIFIFCGTAVLISFNLKNWSNNFNPSYLQLIHNNMIHKNVSYFLTTVMNYSLLLPTLTLIHVMQLIQAPTTLTTNNCNCTTKKTITIQVCHLGNQPPFENCTFLATVAWKVTFGNKQIDLVLWITT